MSKKIKNMNQGTGEKKELYGYDAWDAETKCLTDEEIEETINYANTSCYFFSGSLPMDEWEKEHFRLIAKHELTWKEYRPMHMKYVARKNHIDISDELIDQVFG